MARLIVSMNVSLDGFIEASGEDDGSWLHIDDEVHQAFNRMAQSAALFVYGRKVFEVMVPYWPDAAADASKPQHEHEYGRIWVDKPKVVISTSLQETRWSTRVIGMGALGEIERLKREATSDILCYGGSQLASTLQAVGLVDEYALFVHPAALGAGKPFFREHVPLRLLDNRRFENGTLFVRYQTVANT